MIPLGTTAPEFELPDTLSGKNMRLNNQKGENGTLIMFICNHCPYVIHVINELVSIAKAYKQRGINTIAISSNDIEKYPEDSPEKMEEFARDHDFTFPYLFDESQDVARSYMAACTPDLYVFDSSGKCFYRGRLDEARPGNDKPVNGKDLRNALESMISGKPAPEEQFPSAGCNIKWKSN
jgi:peroxiredoxin